jgi:chromosome segregation ATPase
MSPLVDLSNFTKYVEDNIKRISELYKEVEEVQYQFNDLHGKLMTQWQKQVEATAPKLLADDLPPVLRAPLATAQQQEREALEKRIAELAAQAADADAESAKTLQEAQAELARLREMNPLLNEREEQLKSRSLAELEAIGKAEADTKALGFFTRFLGGSEPQKRLLKLQKQHAKTLADLAAVRESWVQKKKEAETRQAELRGKWEAASVKASQLKAEGDYLKLNLLGLAGKRGAQRLLTEMSETPAVEGEWRRALQEIVELNRQIKEYRAGLTSVAESLGILTGVRTGMERFYQSVSKLYEEQTRFNLKPLKVDLAKSVVEFHNIWAEFRGKVKDDKYLGKRPLEFSQTAQAYTQSRLTDQAIKDMFERMGQALTTAAKAWK